jgi:hypothetical protein
MTEKLYNYTFKDTGVRVQIRKVSPMLVVELQRSFPAPTPPRQRVEVAGEMVEEANPSDPDYIAAKERHGQELEMRVRKLMIQRGVIIPPDNTGWQAEVAELKAFWLETYGAELEGNEKELYVSHIAIGTDSDYLELVEAITRRSQPTEGEIAAAKASFPG